MDAKKNKNVDLREKRGLFFQIGMVVSLAIVFSAFQWTSIDNLNDWDLNSELNFEPEDVWLPVRTERKPLEPPKPKTIETLTIIDDIAADIPDILVEDTEGDMETAITIVEMDPEEVDKTEPEVFWIVEDMPAYPGGNNKLMKDIMSRVVYPEDAKENNVQGRVSVGFIVNKRGEVVDVKIIRSVDKSLDNEAIRVIETLSGWAPGMQRKKAVSVAFIVPINFRLR